MPFVEIKLLAGVTRAQKAALVEDVTRSLVERANKRPETIHIVITEVAEENWGFAGHLTDARPSRSAAEAASAPAREDAHADSAP